MRTLLAVVVSLVSLHAFADCTLENLTRAAEALEDARATARQAGGNCRNALRSPLKKSIREVDSFRDGADTRKMYDTRAFIAGLLAVAAASQCSPAVSQQIGRALPALDAAIASASAPEERVRRFRPGHGWGPGGQGRDDDDDDGQPPPPPGPPGPPPAQSRVTGTLAPLRVTYSQNFGNELAVKVEMPQATLKGMGRGGVYYFGGRFRPQGGQWSEWTTSSTYNAPKDPFTWNNVYSHLFPYSALRAADTANGRFVAQLAVFDQVGSQIVTREVPMEVAFAQPSQPVPPPPYNPNQPAPPPPYNPNQPPPPPPLNPGIPPPPVMMVRDCGTGPDDTGCTMKRGGNLPMDRETFNGLLGSLQGANSDFTRVSMCKAVFGAQWLTAKQLGLVLDLFNSDNSRLEVATFAAPHVVNPQHALGLAGKFRSSYSQRDFTDVMSRQR